MRNNIEFGRWEATSLLINLVLTKLFLSYTRIMMEDAGTAGWILSAVSSLVAVFAYSVLLWLYRKFPGMDILDIAETAGGNFLRIFTGFVLSGILLAVAVIVIREFSEDIKVIILPISPLSYVMAFFAIGMAAGSFLGIEAIARFHALAVPFILAGYIIIILCTIPDMQFSNLFPILGSGLGVIVAKGIARSSVFLELIIIFLLPPFMEKKKRIGATGFIVIALCSACFIAGTLALIMTFGYPSGLEPFLPIYQLARLVDIGKFFERIESIFVIIWAMSALLYLAAAFYFSVYTYAKSAGLKYLRPLIAPFIIMVFGAAFIPSNLVSIIKIETDYIYSIVGIGTFAYVAAVMAAADIRRLKGKKGTHT